MLSPSWGKINYSTPRKTNGCIYKMVVKKKVFSFINMAILVSMFNFRVGSGVSWISTFWGSKKSSWPNSKKTSPSPRFPDEISEKNPLLNHLSGVRSGEGAIIWANKCVSLRIQSPKLRVGMEPKYLSEEVIIHPDHHLKRWLDPWGLGLKATSLAQAHRHP